MLHVVDGNGVFPKFIGIRRQTVKNLPDIYTSGTATGVTEALINGLKNPPTFKDAKNLIVIVCEGLTTELIESVSGELALKNLPVKGTTSSKFTDGEGKILADYVINDLFTSKTGIAAWGELSTNSMRRMKEVANQY